MADIVTMAKDELRAKGKADAAALAARAVSGEANDQELLDNPITAARGMEYQYGLYYLDPEDSQLYLCTRTGEAEGGKGILQYLPHELIGHYFEEAGQ